MRLFSLAKRKPMMVSYFYRDPLNELPLVHRYIFKYDSGDCPIKIILVANLLCSLYSDCSFDAIAASFSIVFLLLKLGVLPRFLLVGTMPYVAISVSRSRVFFFLEPRGQPRFRFTDTIPCVA